MDNRNVRVSLALTVAEYAALDWYARRANVPTSSLGRTFLLEAMLPRLQAGTIEGEAYRVSMKAAQMPTIDQERG